MQNSALANNVVRLPAAAKRRVVQPLGLALFDAAQTLPQHPAQWQDHGGRKAWQEGRFDQSAEMLIVSAIFKLLSDDQKGAVRSKIETLCDLNASPHAASALAVLEAIK